jgi:hypothetical protein
MEKLIPTQKRPEAGPKTGSFLATLRRGNCLYHWDNFLCNWKPCETAFLTKAYVQCVCFPRVKRKCPVLSLTDFTICLVYTHITYFLYQSSLLIFWDKSNTFFKCTLIISTFHYLKPDLLCLGQGYGRAIDQVEVSKGRTCSCLKPSLWQNPNHQGNFPKPMAFVQISPWDHCWYQLRSGHKYYCSGYLYYFKQNQWNHDTHTYSAP